MPNHLDQPLLPEDDVATVGQIVRNARHARGLTLEALSREAQVSRRLLNALELGENWPQVPHFVRICRAAPLSMDVIFGLEMDPIEKKLFYELRKRPGLAAAFLAMLKLEEPVRQRVRKT
jgi:transcriptional regulator with XRE-family HTH domain